MNRIDQKFNELKGKRRPAFIAYLTVGFPDLDTNFRLIREMVKRGVSLVELGVPFSDPIADGPTIQASSQAALERGTTFSDALHLARRVRENSDLPLVLMGYLNPFLSRGQRLAGELAQAEIDGVIIPDLPPEEGGSLGAALRRRGVYPIFLLAPTSPPERIRTVARTGKGFIYYVSRAGVTGERKDLAGGLAAKVREIKNASDLPVCVGFGVSSRRQVEEIGLIADGVIVGSALIRPFLEERTVRAGMRKVLSLLDRLLG
jgi:tryptophan synthase alpha chain